MQNVEALNIITMSLLVFFMARPFSHWIRCCLFVFIEAMVVSKTLFQLPLVRKQVHLSEDGVYVCVCAGESLPSSICVFFIHFSLLLCVRKCVRVCVYLRLC